MSVVIGVDVGAMLTDAVLIDDRGGVAAAKVPLTPPDYSHDVCAQTDHQGELLDAVLTDGDQLADTTMPSLNALLMRTVVPAGLPDHAADIALPAWR
jgi:N-methylhydantoinase A